MPYEPEHVSKLTTLAFADNDAIYTAEEMDGINNTLDNRISTLDNEHSSLETEVDTLKDLVSVIEARIDSLELRTPAEKLGDITNADLVNVKYPLSYRVECLENTIRELQGGIEDNMIGNRSAGFGNKSVGEWTSETRPDGGINATFKNVKKTPEEIEALDREAKSTATKMLGTEPNTYDESIMNEDMSNSARLSRSLDKLRDTRISLERRVNDILCDSASRIISLAAKRPPSYQGFDTDVETLILNNHVMSEEITNFRMKISNVSMGDLNLSETINAQMGKE